MAKVSKSTRRARRFTIIFELVEEGGFVVSVPYLGIHTQGETLEEGRAMAEEAIRGYVECLIEEGQPVPEEPAQLDKQVYVEVLNLDL